jgi:ribulose-5-phosphate 4-epimerase/fuculose-1-phosphate aldolase
MSPAPHQLLEELVTAHRILVQESVLDAFGHVSFRDPLRPERFWLASAKSPNLVETEDMLAYGMDGEPIEPASVPLFVERFIHSAIYSARPDIKAVCHHHSPSILPFCISSQPLGAVSQTGAFLGVQVPFWDSAIEFGPTKLLVDSPGQADSLARALGEASMVLMRGHGATVAGRSIREVVFKSVYSCRDADYQRAAFTFGKILPLSHGEIKLGSIPADAAIDRCWSHWSAIRKQINPACSADAEQVEHD